MSPAALYDTFGTTRIRCSPCPLKFAAEYVIIHMIRVFESDFSQCGVPSCNEDDTFLVHFSSSVFSLSYFGLGWTVGRI
ncbi:hypothetical protein M378DRAFT_159935, partial [Amanita muscaria Koide BX008]